MRELLKWRRYRGKQVPNCYQQGKDRHYKEWRTTCGRYRVFWRNTYNKISLDAGFYPTTRGNPDDGLTWDKLSQSQYKLNRTLNAAQRLCETHFRQHFQREAAALMGRCEKKGCRKQAIEGTERCQTHTLKRKTRASCTSTGKPSDKPAKKKKRKAAMKACPKCKVKVGSRKAQCDCGHEFYKVKAKK